MVAGSILLEDISEKREAEHKISWLARHDTLTELANRFHFREELTDTFADLQTRRRLRPALD